MSGQEEIHDILEPVASQQTNQKHAGADRGFDPVTSTAPLPTPTENPPRARARRHTPTPGRYRFDPIYSTLLDEHIALETPIMGLSLYGLAPHRRGPF
ncbi:hypothetical protein CMI37_28075 [Candidatus Pacearchaeota archaeon]|nr:hypothetical protein [Candidatus Pacearchaeota archaeon]